jgi:hypothetical protein
MCQNKIRGCFHANDAGEKIVVRYGVKKIMNNVKKFHHVRAGTAVLWPGNSWHIPFLCKIVS